jgi:hypothetical protein
MKKTSLGLAAMLVCVAAGLFAAAASAAAPQNTSSPAISGTLKAGSTLTANDGSWSNTPTSFTYQWQRCASDGRTCGDIVSATSKTYTPVTGDVGHALRVVVTATNADGKASATSDATEPISSASGPTNTVRPAIGGTAAVGSTLRVTNGAWTPAPSSFARQWQRCDASGSNCINIAGATGQTYGVRAADAGHRLRVHVTARSASGSTIVATAASDVVPGATTTTVVTTTTTTTTTTPPANRAPSLGYISLRVVGGRAYARFRVCDDKPGRLTIRERDSKNRVLSVSHTFSVTLTGSCAVYARSWKLAKKFRTRGRYASSLRAIDRGGRLSLLRSRGVTFR